MTPSVVTGSCNLSTSRCASTILPSYPYGVAPVNAEPYKNSARRVAARSVPYFVLDSHSSTFPIRVSCVPYGSGGIGLGCFFAIRNSRTATGSLAALPCSLRQRPIARLVVRASSPRGPSSHSTLRLPVSVPIRTSYPVAPFPCPSPSRGRAGP